MKSGENGLIGPNSNDYGRTEPYHSHKVIKNEKSGSKKVIKELTPELADKIWNSIQQSLHDKRVSKEMVLHHLKQLKSQMGKDKKKCENNILEWDWFGRGIECCMKMIDAKIEKVKAL